MSLIQIQNLTFSHEESIETIFENVSLELDTDWKLGLIGRNGRGKTTLLKLLMGAFPYSGQIRSDAEFEYFPYEVDNPSDNALDVIDSLATEDARLWALKKELSLLHVEEEALHRPYGSLSPGERTKVLLASLFCKENRFLLIDEPTDHLDMQAREIVGRYLNAKKGFILVSHDRYLLDSCVDHILAINRAGIDIQKGNFTTWYQNKQNQDRFEMDESTKLKKEIGRLSGAAQQTSNWSNRAEKAKYGTRNAGLRPDRGYVGHKSAKMMKRAKSIAARREKAALEKAKLLKNIETAEPLKIQPLPHHSKMLVELNDIALFYGSHEAVRGIGLTLMQGDRIAICGANGSGKSSILKLVAAKDIRYSGRMRQASNLKISYVPQDTSGLCGRLDAFATDKGIDHTRFRTILRKLDFSRLLFEKDMAYYSDGQKKKVLLAKSLSERAHLYIWDEPLNYIDALSRLQIEMLLQTSGLSILFVEHDRAFVDVIATKVLSL